MVSGCKQLVRKTCSVSSSSFLVLSTSMIDQDFKCPLFLNKNVHSQWGRLCFMANRIITIRIVMMKAAHGEILLEMLPCQLVWSSSCADSCAIMCI